uniref:PiggyBac transposable element-derived protein domain-containing protein n=1 Tax=Timema genevievae TaxID=629358 RepID=A0A7R9PQH3_TIMGE|nr:unnamed protein product [Timema genevievae]
MSTEEVTGLTLDEIISILDDDENILEAKVFMGPPENPLLNSEDEDFINSDINHLSDNQLRATAELHAKHLQDTGIASTIMGEEDIPEEYLENFNTPDNENKWLHAVPKDANVSTDEAIVPYYGRHGAKQHIHGKPICFGYKVWCLCCRLGYLVQGEPYQGASTEELKSKGHYSTGTIRSNRIEKASFEEASTLKKKVRGSYSQMTDTDSGITLIRYHDNNIYSIRVTLGPSPKRLKKRVCDDIRLDGLNHVIVKSMTQIRCGE